MDDPTKLWVRLSRTVPNPQTGRILDPYRALTTQGRPDVLRMGGSGAPSGLRRPEGVLMSEGRSSKSCVVTGPRPYDDNVNWQSLHGRIMIAHDRWWKGMAPHMGMEKANHWVYLGSFFLPQMINKWIVIHLFNSFVNGNCFSKSRSTGFTLDNLPLWPYRSFSL